MDFSKHIQKAEEAFRRRNYDFAAELYRQLVDLDPDLGEARAGLRQALRKRLEAKGGGGKILRAVAGALPLGRAIGLRKLGRHDACARALEDYLRANPLDEEANLLLGKALEDAEHYRSARAVYEFVAEIAPQNPEGLKRAGAMMYRTGDHERALAYYERALAVDPRDQEALKARKNLAAETALSHRDPGAVAHSRELIRDKDHAASLERAQRLHLSEADLRAELARLETAFAANSADPEIMLSLAQVHEKLGDPEAALDVVRRAAQFRKDSLEIVSRVGDLETKVLKRKIARADRAGDAEEAGRLERELLAQEMADGRRRVEIRPGDATLRLQLAKKLLRGGQIDEALGELQRCQAEPRVRDEAAFYMGRCFHEKGILDLARKQYERALETTNGTDDRAKEILYNLGSIAEAEGKTAEARSFFIRIYEVDIGYRDVAAKMGTPD
ncbi:MAG: tetratricopeptide repeat protein [Planctomycetota bacterium]